ncbi:hypothetical protein [Cohnella soli]|uniref:Uncharacterized protein n=1 Tax=Cohnella soli TaxID=425005 RepID=A0ABW0HQQ8_9BACL
MDDPAIKIVSAIIIIGLCTWIFLSPFGLNNSVTTGYDKLKTEVRSYGYKPGP